MSMKKKVYEFDVVYTHTLLTTRHTYMVDADADNAAAVAAVDERTDERNKINFTPLRFHTIHFLAQNHPPDASN